MAARFCDSFDAYADGDVLLRWTTRVQAFGTAQPAISAGTGRNGTASMRYNSGGNSWRGYITKTIDNQVRWIVGCAFRTSSLAGSVDTTLFGVGDAGTMQVDIRYNGLGQLYLTRNGTTLGTSGSIPVANTYLYLELDTTIDPVNGIADLWVNGVRVLHLTGQNTRASANSYANQIILGPFAGGGNAIMDYDDLYVLDGTGLAPLNAVLGDSRVQAVVPNGNGATDQYTPVGAVSNFQCVNQAAEDGDTTYVSSATAGQIDLYTFPAIAATSGSVAFVQSMLVARKDDAGARTIQPIVRQGVTNTLVGAQHNLGTGYQQWLDIQATDPTGAAWTIANLNAAQFGQEEIA